MVAGVAMSATDAAYNHDRYRKLLAEADNETKRVALIHLLIEEKARDRLAQLRLYHQISATLDAPRLPSL
jgi:hypothetical protein